jgi:DAACS family dicarboxylate/amino acid:cation (Na+ or H+) symporter
MKLWAKILIALLFGVITGIVLGEQSAYLKPVGDAFLRLLSMIIVPLVLASMTVGITSIHDPQKLSRIGIKSLTFYLITTLLSIGLGVFLGHLFGVGKGLHFTANQTVAAENFPSLTSILLDVIPRNPIRSLVEENILQVITFAVFLGISINFAGERGKPVREFLESLADVMYRLTSIVMEFSPIGVFALMAWVTGTFGIQTFNQLLGFLATYYFACSLHLGVFVCLFLWVWLRLNPIAFYRGMSDAIMLAFSTSSSSAALPVTMHCVQENLGVSKNISSFILPLGSTVNMNGAGIYQGMAVMFISHAYGIELSWQQLAMIMVTATLSSVGAAGIPGSGWVMLSAVFSSVGLPIEGMALLVGIDRPREMVSTICNIIGDAVCAVYIGKQEGELDEQQYNHEVLVELEPQD